jgi:hypothetical protein
VFVVRCVEHKCVGLVWGLKSMMRQVLLPVHDRACMCFELQCNLNKLNNSPNIFLGLNPLYHGLISPQLKMKLRRHILAQSTLTLLPSRTLLNGRTAFFIWRTESTYQGVSGDVL